MSPAYRPLLHPAGALLLAGPIAFFPAALLSDITYLNTAEIQWTNFSAWLITGGLVTGGLALAGALVGAWRDKRTGAGPRYRLLTLLLLGAWIAGLVNAFQHSRDAWSSVGTTGLILSILSSLLALVAGWIAFRGYREAL